MTIPTDLWQPVGLTVICVLGLIVAEWRTSQSLKWIFKPLAALGFLWAAYAGEAFNSLYGQTVFTGLALCAVGDICLIPARVGRWFLVGLASFLLGHVAYAIAFIMRGTDTIWLGAVTIPLTLIALRIYRWLSVDVDANMKKPVQAYIIVISTMVALAVATSAHPGDHPCPKWSLVAHTRRKGAPRRARCLDHRVLAHLPGDPGRGLRRCLQLRWFPPPDPTRIPPDRAVSFGR